jgi:hypothetical protein
MPKDTGYGKPTYREAVKDRVKDMLGIGVKKVQDTGTGGTIKARPRALEDRIAEAEGGNSRRRNNQSTDSNN